MLIHKIDNIFNRLKKSSLFKDSFWAVSGNGIGNFLMLISGILIARFLGKDLYGEYGIVKTTMFLIALFATFGIGDTSTKFIAEYIQKDKSQIRLIVRASLKIVLLFSATLCLVLILFAKNLAEFVKVPQMTLAFRFLGVIIIFRALNTVGAGLLGGFKEYKRIGKNNVVSGVSMLILSIPLTYCWNLYGALISLLFSQVLLSIMNLYSVREKSRNFELVLTSKFEKKLVSFSFPFALNEFVYTFSAWGCTLLLTRYSSVGELGISTACAQWESIILFMPGLLGNVILSYLSSTAGADNLQHKRILNRMLLVNFISTVIPLIIVLIFAPLITMMYGASFIAMKPVLVVTIMGTVFACLSRVYLSNLTSEGKNWRAFMIRGSQHTLKIIATFIMLRMTNGINAAYNLAWVSFLVSFLTFVMYYADYRFQQRQLV